MMTSALKITADRMALAGVARCITLSAFRFGSGLREKVVHTGLGRDRRSRQLVVAGDHDGANSHAAQLREALLDSAFDYILELDASQHAGHVRNDEGCRALAGDLVRCGVD